MPYRNRSNVGPTIAHPAPAAITIRQGFRPHLALSLALVMRPRRFLTPESKGARVLSPAPVLLGNRGHETVVKCLRRQNPSLVHGGFHWIGRCAALIDAKVHRIATVAGDAAGFILVGTGVLGWRHALQYGAV